MKKIAIVVAVVGSVSLLASCAKDHTCSCTTTTTGVISGTATADTVFQDMKKSDAESACTGLNESWSALGTTYTVECALQ